MSEVISLSELDGLPSNTRVSAFVRRWKMEQQRRRVAAELSIEAAINEWAVEFPEFANREFQLTAGLV